MATTLFSRARVLTLDASERIIEQGYVVVRDGVIAEVGEGDAPHTVQADRTIGCRGKLIAPGLINAHAHSQSSTMSGFGDKLSHPAFMWLTQAHTSRRGPDEIRLAVYLEAYGLMTSGTTSVIDHFPGQRFTLEDMDAVLSAWNESGMRAALAMRYFDGDFSDIFPSKSLPPDLDAKLRSVEILKPQPTDELSGLMEAVLLRWHGKPRLSVFPAPSNPDRCSDESLRICAELAERFDTGIHTHLLETRKQADLAEKRYGATTVGHLDDIGVLSDRWSCAHSIWLTDNDIDLMASRGVTAVLNPESNARLGTGLARVPDMMRRGVNLALGSDGSSANDNLVLHEAMRAVATAHRAVEPDRSRWISGRDALRMATAGGAGALRQSKLGAIAPGYAADLVIYRLDTPWWIPINNLVNQLVFSETGASVDIVMIDGALVVEGGKVKSFDAEALQKEIAAMVTSLRQRNEDLFAVAEAIATLVP
ncbi:MAG TPA: amidohydrolase family protein [Pseudolabrys sp.]|nr:amidohydrolase family protein [Pseudolabrys sp.]